MEQALAGMSLDESQPVSNQTQPKTEDDDEDLQVGMFLHCELMC